MRKIIFRGKPTKEERENRPVIPEWVYGSLHNEIEDKLYIVFYSLDCKKIKVNVKTDTVCQYTGMSDKNDTCIFEGDIVANDDESVSFCVKWDNTRGMYKCYFPNNSSFYCNLSDDYIQKYFTVVGNIHDNKDYPEELKK